MEYVRLIRQVLQLSLHRGYSVALLTNQSMTKFSDRGDGGYSAILGELKRCIKDSLSGPGTVHNFLKATPDPALQTSRTEGYQIYSRQHNGAKSIFFGES